MSNSSCVNTGFNAPSAINSIILVEYFESPLAKAPFDPKLMLAPKKSISSLKASFEMVFVPFPIKLLVKSETPFLAPSAYGALSMVRLYETLGSLLFSTTKTFNPFFNSKVCGLPMFILGAGPGFGCGLSCACIESEINKLVAIMTIFFMIDILILSFI